MITHKHISKWIVALTVLAVVFCLLSVAMPDKLYATLGDAGVSMEYESELFDTDEIIDIDILMDQEDWDTMLENAMSEEYYTCDVVVNGQKVHNVAIRPKGNTSLSAIVSDPDSDRFSLKLEFDHFVEGQTCFGLDKLILNNDYADATNMKEAIVYDMFQYLGADASLYNYAKVSVNGEYTGVYLALEGVEDSFMLRNFGTQDGELYKPDSMEMGGGKNSSGDQKMQPPSSGPGGQGGPGGFDPGNMPEMGDFDPGNMPEMGDFDPGNMPEMGDFDPGNMPEMGDFDPGNMPEMGNFDPENMPERPDRKNADDATAQEQDATDRENRGGPGGPGGFSMGGGGASLNYTDDEEDSYQTIWDGSITNTGKKDHKRVIKALKKISEGEDLEKYLDVDNILKYMAVHAFSVNMDSLSGNMAHNYYLYEYDGQLNLFPWDYNLSFGGMSMGSKGDATSVVNDAIDTPFDGTQFFDALLANEEYLAIYHGYLKQLAEEYVDNGRFDEVYTRIRSRIDDLVADDPTAFYSYEEYDTAAKTLNAVVHLRAQSIEGQLDGSIPSTDEGQKQDPSVLIDASDIDIDSMGEFNMGGAKDGGPRHQRSKDASNENRPNFAGMQEQQEGSGLKTWLLYGGCMAVMLTALIILWNIRRRKHR